MATADRQRSSSALVLLACGMIVFGTGTPLSKLVTEHLPPMLGSLIRVALAALVLAPFLVARRRLVRQLARRDCLMVGTIALIGVFGFTLAMVHGMRLVSGVAGSIVMSTTPAVTALAARIFFAERLGWRKRVAIVLAVAGVVVLHLGGEAGTREGSEVLLGSALVFAAVCCEATYTLVGKRVSEQADPELVAGLAAAASVVLLIPLGLADLGSFALSSVPLEGWLAVAFWGAGTFGLGTVLWYSGLARASGTTAAGFMGLMPISALVFSYVLLGEPFRWLHLLGFLIVLSGVALIAWDHLLAAKNDEELPPRHPEQAPGRPAPPPQLELVPASSHGVWWMRRIDDAPVVRGR